MTARAARGDGRGDAPRWPSRVALGAILVGTALLRLRLLAVPLERDEGEYAYMAQLILAGEMPYVAAHNMKLPGVYYAYAAILGLLGETEAAVRLGLLAINLAAIVLVSLLGRTLLGDLGGLAAAAFYAVLSLSPAVAGFAANAEHFVVVFALAGALLLARPGEPRRLARVVGAGLLLGTAVVMKQHGAAFVAFGGVHLLATGLGKDRTARQRALGEAGAFAVASLAPFGLTCAGMYLGGAFEPFWFWTVTYAREYMTMIPMATTLAWLGSESARIVGAAVPIWALAGYGLVALARPARPRRAAFLALFCAGSFGAVSLGLRYTDHYFILLLPAAALLAGLGTHTLVAAIGRRAPRLALALALGVPLTAVALALAQERQVLGSASPIAISRAVNGSNPFPEAIEIARYLAARTEPDDRIAVVGSEPEIYFLARRRAATRYIYMYPLMERHPFALAMQEEMIAELERAAPPYLVLVNVPTSWSRRTHSHGRILAWAEETVRERYEPVGLAEIVPGEPTRYRWDEAARNAVPASPYYVATFRRRS